MAKLTNRRGAILVLAAFLMVVVLGMFVAVVDLSRAFMQKNELQTSVDAAALAGALELYRDAALVDDSAISFGIKNKVLKLNPTITSPNVNCGIWDDITRTFTPSAGCNYTDNAVEVTGNAPVQSSLANFMSLGNKQLASKAIAWLAYVNGSKCVKPIGLPYAKLTYAVRPDLGNPVDPNPQRDLTEGDLFRLRTYTPAQLRFVLKQASGSDDRTGPGNYGAVDLDGNSGGGASAYEADLSGCDDNQIGVGSTINTEPGNMAGPTIDGFVDLCINSGGSMVGDECRQPNGDVGVNVLVPLWYSATPVNGNVSVTVKMIAAFKLESVKQNNPDKASITGYFTGFAAGGSIGTVKTTVTRPILVR